MDWKLDKARPICPQICEQLYVGIASGKIAPGEKLMSVREVALAAGVNPNTVQKSFEQLERSGAVYSVRGSGWFVAENTETAVNVAKDLVKNRVAEFFEDMKRLGVDADGAKKYVEEWTNE